jgi:hypothetical protein
MPTRPVAPVRVEGACPFECCAYSTWTTRAQTRLYAAPDDTTASPVAILSAGIRLDAQTGHVLLTHLGEAVVRDSAYAYTDFETGFALPDGARVPRLGYVGEGAFRVWHDGTLAEAPGEALSNAPGAPPSGFVTEREAESQWWAKVRLPDGRVGWLWMDRSEIDIPYGC